VTAGATPLSAKEQALWLFQSFAPEAGVLNVRFALRMAEPVRWWPLDAAVRQLVARHPAMRTLFPAPDGLPERLVLDPGDKRIQPVIEVRATTPENFEHDLGEFAAQPFDLARDLPLRVGWFKHDSAGDAICVSVHHLVADWASADILARELVDLFRAFRTTGRAPAHLSSAAPTFTEPAASSADIQYWREHLAGADRVERRLDLGRTGADERSFAGGSVRSQLSAEAADAVSTMSRDLRVTQNMVHFAAYCLLLSRHGMGSDVVVAVPVDVRDKTAGDVVGFHINMVAIRATVAPETTFRALVHGIREVFLSALLHVRASIDDAFPGAYEHAAGSRNPLFRHMFNYRAQLALEAAGDEPAPEPVDIETRHSRMDLELRVIPGPDSTMLQGVYRREAFDGWHVRTLLARYDALLLACASRPTCPVGELPIWSPADRALVATANDTAGARAEPAVPATVARHAAATPSAPAVTAGGITMTYRELITEAGALAARLRAAGVRPGDVVAACVEPGLMLPVGPLAIWQTGAVWLPIAPGEPAGRSSQWLAAASAKIVLADHAAAAGLAGGRPIVRLPRPAGLGHRRPSIPCEPVMSGDSVEDGGIARPDHDVPAWLAGPPGEPAAGLLAEISHHGLARALGDIAGRLCLSPGAAALWLPSADVAMADFLLPLIRGAHLIVSPADVPEDPGRLVDLLARWHPAVIMGAPAALARLADLPAAELTGRRVFSSSGSLSPYLIDHVISAGGKLLSGRGHPQTAFWSTVASSSDSTLSPAEWGSPIGNTRMCVVGPGGDELPPGLWGELHIAGPSTARGYVGRPDLTDERFHQHGGLGRCFRSGVVGRWRFDGKVETLDRPRAAPRPPSTENATDTSGLAAHIEPASSREGCVPMAEEFESLLLTLLRELLAKPQLTADSNFFLNGGNSLLAARAVARIQKLTGVRLSLRTFFREPTPAALAHEVALAARAADDQDQPAGHAT
jgi:non-ribosomal peptide synthetase component F